MLFSTFSHRDFFHLAFNMIALYSMTGLIENSFPVEQFLAFYLSAGKYFQQKKSTQKKKEPVAELFLIW